MGASETSRLAHVLDQPSPPSPLKHNFNLPVDRAEIKIYGVGGREVWSTRKYDLWTVREFCPQVVLLTVGGNDLSHFDVQGRPEVVGNALFELAEHLHKDLGVHKVVVPSLNPRIVFTHMIIVQKLTPQMPTSKQSLRMHSLEHFGITAAIFLGNPTCFSIEMHQVK